MKQYMVSIKFPENPPAEFVSLISPQRDLITDLLNKGFILDVLLSEDRRHLWLLVNSETKDDIIEIIKTFPLYPFMEYNIDELLFRFSYASPFSQMSLN